MITPETALRLVGRAAYGVDGAKLGTISQIYLDNVTGQPHWATVRTGLFGSRESFVPLSGAGVIDAGLHVLVDRDRVRSAPTIDADGELPPEEEIRLYEHYGLDADGSDDEPADRADRAASADEASSADPVLTRSAEQARVVGTEAYPARRARLRKQLVTEYHQVTVPVTHEEVRVEEEPWSARTAGPGEPAASEPAASEPSASSIDDDPEVVLHEQRVVVGTETVPVERVRLRKERITEGRSMDVDLQEERIDAEVDRGGRPDRDRS